MTVSDFLTPGLGEPKVPVGRWIALQAELLRDAVRRGVPAATDVLRFAGLIQAPDSEFDGDRALDVETARLAVAKYHGYPDLADALAHGDDQVDTRFEAAADAIHAGDLDTLRRLLDAESVLVRMRSPFPHRQTLLHHVAANGIEVERQGPSPGNAVDILRLLIDRGADPDATCDSYGGGNGATTLCLLVSSAWPAAAGVQAALVEELCGRGARVNGIDDDGLPLWTAISFGYTDAAEALARCGARVDNLCFAAALGDLEAVGGYFDINGDLRDDVPPVERVGAGGPDLEPDRIIEYALIWAAAHDRPPVVKYLLTKNPDLGVSEPCFHATALGAARYYENQEIVAILEPITRAGVAQNGRPLTLTIPSGSRAPAVSGRHIVTPAPEISTTPSGWSTSTGARTSAKPCRR
jgi:ankyrin repeat protein